MRVLVNGKVTAAGVERKRRLAGLDVIFGRFNGSDGLAPHRHSYGVFCVMLEGWMAEARNGARTAEYGPATVIYRPPEDVHANRFARSGTLKVTLEPTSREPLHMLQEFGFRPAVLFTSSSVRCMALGMRIYRELREAEAGVELMIEGLVLELFGEICRLQQPKAGASRVSAWAQRVHARIREEFTASLTVADYARAEGLHPIYVAQAFRTAYGLTIGQYIRQLRVKRAAQLIQQKAMPFAEIALASGFYDQAHFSRVFKEELGLTPTEFRRLAAGYRA